MTLLKPSRAKIVTTFIFIVFYLLNSAMQSAPKKLYKQEATKYYTFKGETPEIVKSRDKYISEAYAQLTTPSDSETERMINLGCLNITSQLTITFILAYFFSCLIHRARPTAPA